MRYSHQEIFPNESPHFPFSLHLTMRYIIWLLLFQVSVVFGQEILPDCQSAKRFVPLRGGGAVTDPANRRSDTLDVLN
jgi:hypothetical protein